MIDCSAGEEGACSGWSAAPEGEYGVEAGHARGIQAVPRVQVAIYPSIYISICIHIFIYLSIHLFQDAGPGDDRLYLGQEATGPGGGIVQGWDREPAGTEYREHIEWKSVT